MVPDPRDRGGGGRPDVRPAVPALTPLTPTDDRFKRFALMLRRAALMVARWVETEYPECDPERKRPEPH